MKPQGKGNFRDSGRKNFSSRRFDSGPREMHKAVCSDCKQECEVPFKPTEGRAVYCKDCYSKNRN